MGGKTVSTREQARARRLGVALAAWDLFERDGFRPTTINTIAACAGVSPESICKGFGRLFIPGGIAWPS